MVVGGSMDILVWLGLMVVIQFGMDNVNGGFDWVAVLRFGTSGVDGWSVAVIVVQLACNDCWVVFDDGGYALLKW